jgi:DNA-binding MarR family transcriptional regulator
MRSPRSKDNVVDPTGEFPLNPSAYLFYLLFQVARQRDVHYDAKLAAAGLTLQRWRILAVIRRIENCSMKDLALFSAVDRTTLTRAVDQMVAEGLVTRWSSPRDRRRVNVTLGDKGEAIFAEAMVLLRDGNAAMLAGVEDDALRGASRVLQQVVRNLMGDPFAAEKLLNYRGSPQPE